MKFSTSFFSKVFFVILTALYTLSFFGCGSSHPAKNPKAISGNLPLAGIPFSAFFLATNFTDSATLFSWNPRSSRAEKALALPPNSTDPLLFADGKSGGVLLLERFSQRGQDSRLTFVGETRSPEITGLPKNVSALVRDENGFLLAVGFDDGRLASLAPGVYSKPENTTEPQAGRSRIWSPAGLEGADKSLMGILSDTNANIWIVSMGVDKAQGFAPIPARAHLLNKARTAILKSVDVRDPNGVACRNAFENLPVSSGEILLSCDPAFFGKSPGATSIFSLSLDASGNPAVRVVRSAPTTEIQILRAQAVFDFGENGGRRVLIEKVVSGLNARQRILGAAWVSLAGIGADWPVLEFSGRMQPLQNGEFLFRCVLENETCASQALALVQETGLRSGKITRKLDSGTSLSEVIFPATLPDSSK